MLDSDTLLDNDWQYLTCCLAFALPSTCSLTLRHDSLVCLSKIKLADQSSELRLWFVVQNGMPYIGTTASPI
jgi:hypothetical protein